MIVLIQRNGNFKVESVGFDIVTDMYEVERSVTDIVRTERDFSRQHLKVNDLNNVQQDAKYGIKSQVEFINSNAFFEIRMELTIHTSCRMQHD